MNPIHPFPEGIRTLHTLPVADRLAAAELALNTIRSATAMAVSMRDAATLVRPEAARHNFCRCVQSEFFVLLTALGNLERQAQDQVRALTDQRRAEWVEAERQQAIAERTGIIPDEYAER